MFSIDWFRTKIRSDDFYTVSKRLSEFRRRDFSSMQEIMKSLFPRSWDIRVSRDLPIVEAISKTASLYRRPPFRTCQLSDGSGQLSTEQTTALNRIFSALRVNEKFKAMHECGIVQRTVLGVILPRPGAVNRYSIRIFEPFECEVDPDELQHESINDAKEFRFSVPISATHSRVEYGKIIINKDKAVYVVNGKESGLYTEDGSNPFEDYPIFCLRLAAAPTGDFFASLPTDIYDCSVSLSISHSDVDHMARYSGGQKVLKNATQQQVESIDLGAETVIGLFDDQEFSVITSQNDLSSYLGATEAFLKQVVIMNGLNPNQFLKSGTTGLSKAFDQYDREVMKEDHAMALQEAENGFLKALRSVLNYGARREAWPEMFVDLVYNEIPPPADPLAKSQANRINLEDGLVSPSELIAKEQNITRERASQILKENIEEYSAIKSILMPREFDQNEQ